MDHTPFTECEKKALKHPEQNFSEQNFHFMLHTLHHIKLEFQTALLWLLDPMASSSTNFALYLAIALENTDFNTDFNYTQTWVCR